MRSISTFFSLLLIPLLTVLPVRAAMADAIPDAGEKASTLQIKLLDSGSAPVAANSTSVQGYTVQVVDSTGLPVSDVAVALRMPDDGPSGSFADGSRASVTYTDATGRARFSQILWGAADGTVSVRVTAVKGASRAGALIQQVVNPAAAAAGNAKAPVTPAPVPPTAVAPAPVSTSPVAASANAAPAAAPTSTANVRLSKPAPVPGTPKSSSPKVVAGLPPMQSGADAAQASPAVSITNTSASGTGSVHTGGGSNTKKWVLLAIVAGGAGLGAALALSGHGGAAAAPTTSALTIGSPTLSVGH